MALPGAGHVAIGEPRRGLTFVLFMMLFSMLTLMTKTEVQSFIGRHADPLFDVWLDVLRGKKPDLMAKGLQRPRLMM